MNSLLDLAGEATATEIPGYELGPPLGRGGMGEVFSARRLTDDSAVAVKLALPGARLDTPTAERLTREAAALARLDHPRVVRVLDSGFTRDGRFFLVTPLATGGDLAQLLRAGPLPIAAALELFRQILSAVAAAHAAGILHRDLKPANVLLDGQGGVWVADFSLARVADVPGGVTVTATGDVFGTPYYLAPEVRHGTAPVDARADVFSLGVLLHELLTGRVPMGHYQPASRTAKVPRALDQLIARCLAESPTERPANAGELLEQFEAALRACLPEWAKWLLVGLLLVAAALNWQRNQPAPSAASPVVTTPAPTNTAPAFPSPAQATREQPWTNSLGMKFVPVPGVAVLFSVWETRRADFDAFAPHGPQHVAATNAPWRTPPGPAEPTHPVTGVDYPAGRAFCDWLTTRERAAGRLRATESYRLPTDAEWSRAAGLRDERGESPEERALARPGERGHYVWGRTWPPPFSGVPANFRAAEALATGGRSQLRHNDGWPFTAPVGSFPANEFGLFDLSGNAAEWCSSRWNDRSDELVLRGGSWDQSAPEALNLATRQTALPVTRRPGFGFRVVLELAPQVDVLRGAVTGSR